MWKENDKVNKSNVVGKYLHHLFLLPPSSWVSGIVFLQDEIYNTNYYKLFSSFSPFMEINKNEKMKYYSYKNWFHTLDLHYIYEDNSFNIKDVINNTHYCECNGNSPYESRVFKVSFRHHSSNYLGVDENNKHYITYTKKGEVERNYDITGFYLSKLSKTTCERCKKDSPTHHYFHVQEFLKTYGIIAFVKTCPKCKGLIGEKKISLTHKVVKTFFKNYDFPTDYVPISCKNKWAFYDVFLRKAFMTNIVEYNTYTFKNVYKEFKKEYLEDKAFYKKLTEKKHIKIVKEK